MTDTTQAVATTSPNKHPIVVLRERLEARHDELKHALPSDISPERFIRALMTSAQINPDLVACTWQSIWIACMRACRDCLLPDGIDGAIVPYKSTATWIKMYQGMLRQFRRSGQFKWVTANVVRQGEEFSHFIDETGEHIRHVPGERFEAPIVKIYAMATTKDGGLFVTVLSKAEADKIRAMSRATREDAPWKMWPEEMYKKTALRRLCKVLPSARDVMGDDDLPELPDAPAIAPQAPTERASGAAAALAQFAGASEEANAPAAGDASAEAGGGVSEGQAVTDKTDAAEMSETRKDDSTAADPIVVAYARGVAAKAAGTRRASVPGEYRDAKRIKECDAWLDGWDGKPQPSRLL